MKTLTRHFGNFNPTWRTSGLFRGVVIIIFFVCLLTMNMCTDFHSSTTNFMSGGLPLAQCIFSFRGGAVSPILYRRVRNLYVNTIFHTPEFWAKFGEFSCTLRGWNLTSKGRRKKNKEEEEEKLKPQAVSKALALPRYRLPARPPTPTDSERARCRGSNVATHTHIHDTESFQKTCMSRTHTA